MVTDRCDAPRRQAPRTIELRFERGDPEAAMAHRSWNALVQLALCNYAHGQFTSVSKEWFECCDYMSSWISALERSEAKPACGLRETGGKSGEPVCDRGYLSLLYRRSHNWEIEHQLAQLRHIVQDGLREKRNARMRERCFARVRA